MAAEGETLYYIDRWSDEIMPCYPSLAAWAEWLSKPDENWDRDAAATDGEQFEASVMRMGEDVIATRGENGWIFSADPKADFFAVRWGGPHSSWDAESIGGDLESLTETLDDGDDEVRIAVGYNQPSVMLTFRAGPPPHCEIAPVEVAA